MALPIGAAAAGAVAGLEDASQQAYRAKVAQLHDLQMQQIVDERAKKRAYQAIIPRLLTSITESPETTMVGGTPGQLGLPIVSADENPEMPTSFTPSIAGRAPVAVTAPTMGSVARAIGPEDMATVVGHPEGRALLKEQGVHTAEQFQQRKRRAQALEEFKTFGEEMQAKYAAGDSLGGLLAERAGYRALAAGAADPSPLLAKANEITKEYAREFERAKKDTEYKQHLAEDGRAYAQGMAEYLDAVKVDAKERAQGRPSDTAALKLNALLETSMKFKSDFGKKKRDVLLAKLEEGIARQIQNEPLVRLNSTTAAILNQQIEKGQPPDYEAARREAFRSNPDGIGALFDAAMTHKTPLSEADLGALGIKGTPKNEYDEAHRAVVDGGIPATDPRYTAAFTAKLTEIKSRRAGATRAPGHDQALDRLVNLRGQKQSELRDVRGILKAIGTTDDDAAEARLEVERLTAEMKDLDQRINERMKGAPPKEKPTAPSAATAAPTVGASATPAASALPADQEKIKATTTQVVRVMFPGKDWLLDEAALAEAKTSGDKERIRRRVLTPAQKERVRGEVQRRLGLAKE